MSPIFSTLLHLVELLVSLLIALAIAWLAKTYLGYDLKDSVVALMTIAFDVLGKLLRAIPTIPVPDYVNLPSVNKYGKNTPK